MHSHKCICIRFFLFFITILIQRLLHWTTPLFFATHTLGLVCMYACAPRGPQWIQQLWSLVIRCSHQEPVVQVPPPVMHTVFCTTSKLKVACARCVRQAVQGKLALHRFWMPLLCGSWHTAMIYKNSGHDGWWWEWWCMASHDEACAWYRIWRRMMITDGGAC